jgi:cytochrome c551
MCLLAIASCGPGQNSKVKGALSSADKILFEKYLIQGKDLYKSKCQNCHMGNGKGLRTLIPPLMAADYLHQNQPEVACLIKNGAQTMLTVNGIAYNPTMPAHADLTNLEIAEVMTYINNSWENEIGLVKANDVQNWLEACN